MQPLNANDRMRQRLMHREIIIGAVVAGGQRGGVDSASNKLGPSGGSQYLNTYEVPHLPHYGAYPSYHHPPAPSLASSHVSSGRHVASHLPGGGYYAGQPI